METVCGGCSLAALASLLVAVAACGGSARAAQPARPPRSPRSDADLCARARPCPEGYGVCVRCDEGGAPRWVWSDALGSPHAVWPIRSEPSCRHFDFDARGRPLRTRMLGERTRWEYDAAGRVTLRALDSVRMCEDSDFGDYSECGPPDGIDDLVQRVRWTEAEDGTVTARGDPRLVLTWDPAGRLVRHERLGEVTTYAYRGDTHFAREERRGDALTRTSHDARGRPVLQAQWRGARITRVRSWRYDGYGNLQAMRLVLPGRGLANDQRWVWTYDARGRPTELTLLDHGETVFTEGRRYDDHGRLVARTPRGEEVRVKRGSDGSVRRVGHSTYRCLAHLWPALTR